MVLSKSDRDCQIEQLKNIQRDKEEEIALIIEQIDAKENLIDSIYFKIRNVCPSLTDEWDDGLGDILNSLRNSLTQDNIALLAATNVRRDKNKKKFTPWGRWKIEQIFGIQQWSCGIKFCWTKTAKAFLALCQFASAVQNFKTTRVFE